MPQSNQESLRRRRPWGDPISTPSSTAEDQTPFLRTGGTDKDVSAESLTPSTNPFTSIDPRQRVSPSWYLESDCSSPDTPRQIQYCVPCRQERASPGYMERVSRLMDPLYCAGCQTEHATIFFSHVSRKTEPRRCIAHEGFYTVCPHLKLSLQDMKATKARQTDLEERCQEPTCPCTDATITHEPVMGCVRFAWSIKDDETEESDSSLDRDVAKLRDLHRSFPPLFCPHLQVSPGRLFHPDRSSAHSRRRRYCCEQCRTSVFVEEDGGSRVITSRFVCYWKDVEGVSGRHIELLGPDTYGHFEDLDSKHITWCDDRSCATTCELVTLSALLSLTDQFNGDSFRWSDGLAMDVFEWAVHRDFGLQDPGSRWRERYSWKVWAKDSLVDFWNVIRGG